MGLSHLLLLSTTQYAINEKIVQYQNMYIAQQARNFKKVQAKKFVKLNESKLLSFFREIAFLAVLNFFSVQKMIFGIF